MDFECVFHILILSCILCTFLLLLPQKRSWQKQRNSDVWVGGLYLHVASCVTGHFFVCMHMCHLLLLFEVFNLSVTFPSLLLANGYNESATADVWKYSSLYMCKSLWNFCSICNPVRVTVFAGWRDEPAKMGNNGACSLVKGTFCLFLSLDLHEDAVNVPVQGCWHVH